MAEIKNNYVFAGLLIAIALVTGTTVYELKPTGSYKVCDNGVGWSFNSNDGYNYCGDRRFDCSSVRNTKTGKPNYFCDDATRIEIKQEIVKSTSSPTIIEK